MLLLTEQLILEAQINKALVLCESEIKKYDPDVNPEFLSNLLESLDRDPELLFEFLGAIAGFGAKAFKGVGDRLQKYSDKKKLKKDQKTAKEEFRQNLHTYAKSLKANKVGLIDGKGKPSAHPIGVAARNLDASRHKKQVLFGEKPKGSKAQQLTYKGEGSKYGRMAGKFRATGSAIRAIKRRPQF